MTWGNASGVLRAMGFSTNRDNFRLHNTRLSHDCRAMKGKAIFSAPGVEMKRGESSCEPALSHSWRTVVTICLELRSLNESIGRWTGQKISTRAWYFFIYLNAKLWGAFWEVHLTTSCQYRQNSSSAVIHAFLDELSNTFM